MLGTVPVLIYGLETDLPSNLEGSIIVPKPKTVDIIDIQPTYSYISITVFEGLYNIYIYIIPVGIRTKPGGSIL